MSDYISREETLERLCKSVCNVSDCKCDEARCPEWYVIHDIPAADVRPVVTCGECKLMYDELVKRLRKEAGEWCANCCYKCGDNVCGAPYDRKKDCDVYTKLHSAVAIERLEAALILMVLQYCTDKDGTLWHQFMCAGEGAFDALGITLKTNPQVLWDRLEKLEAKEES